MNLAADVRTIYFEELKEILPTAVAYQHHHQGEPECLCFIHWHTLMSICRGHCQPVEVMPVGNFWNHVCGSFAPVQVGPPRFFWNLHYVSDALGHTRNNIREWSAVLTEEKAIAVLGDGNLFKKQVQQFETGAMSKAASCFVCQ